MTSLLKILFIFVISFNAYASCRVLTSNDRIARETHDILGIILLKEKSCPHNVLALREKLLNLQFAFQTTMVANETIFHQQSGSFSLFEAITGRYQDKIIKPGDFFIGHFTYLNHQDELALAQAPEENALMIEAFAWDDQKKAYNFYELRGMGGFSQWYYRGDSQDIKLDNQRLHRQGDPEFGNRLRCSACHLAGAGIMKELSQPHNDWWQPSHMFDFAGKKIHPDLHTILRQLVPPKQLQKMVEQSIRQIPSSKDASLQELLRPLFCPMEMNLKSDLYSNDKKLLKIWVPTEFFIDSRLLSPYAPKFLSVWRKDYENALAASKSYLPNTRQTDADHAWLTPVKAYSDKIAIEKLIKQGIINVPFIAAVLNIDMTNPVFSKARCDLLTFVPEQLTASWEAKFQSNLKSAQNENAKQLYVNLTDPKRLSAIYREAAFYLNQCKVKLNNSGHVSQYFHLLLQRRAEIAASDISKNPLGKILEPGFRVIFPVAQIEVTPGKLKLTPNCDLVTSPE